MKSKPKTVQQLKAALADLGRYSYVHHVALEFPMPRVVTIASVQQIDIEYISAFMNALSDEIATENVSIFNRILSGEIKHNPDRAPVGARVKQNLYQVGYGCVAVCSRKDAFNQTRGEIIALGRLLKVVKRSAKRPSLKATDKVRTGMIDEIPSSESMSWFSIHLKNIPRIHKKKSDDEMRKKRVARLMYSYLSEGW